MAATLTNISSSSKPTPNPPLIPSQNQTVTPQPAGSTDSVLAGLIGNNVPSLPLETLARAARRGEPDQAAGPPKPLLSCSKWSLAPFENPARKDGLQLKHWARADDNEVYRFAKYNTTSNVYTYSTEEYYHLLRDDDWTKEETDYLFELLHAYDLRFPVVHDRYDFLDSQRTVDDLKARYYSICQKLVHHRPSTTDEAAKKHLIQGYAFDKQREAERKAHVKSLLSRTASQLAEEQFVYVETRRLEQTLLRRARNRDDLMRLIGGVQYQMFNELKLWPVTDPQQPRPINSSLAAKSAPSTGPTNSSSGRSTNPSQSKKRTSAAGAAESAPESAAPVDLAVQRAEDKKNCIHRLDPSGASQYRSVALRSTRVTLPKTVAASARISGIMSELEIPVLTTLPKPLIMPTRPNVESYEGMIKAANQLAELKRQVERVEAELKVQRKKKDALAAMVLGGQTELETEPTGDHVQSSLHAPGDAEPSGLETTNARASAHKRSASVSSTGSTKAGTARKKSRKT